MNPSQARILLLDDSVARKIAAGEVVDRPASVVKELVENAIDAGSSAISVEASEGGQALLRVSDNGGGIHADDIRLAFMRHATSKIREAEDLFQIHSMGFRGEALYSIAAVSRLELLTRTAESEFGVRYVIEGGVEVSCEPAGCPMGTSVTVRDLFFNTPARQKFMGKPASETGYIGVTVAKLILSHPSVSMKFMSNGKLIYHSPGDGNLLSAITAVYGRQTAAHMLPVDSSQEEIGVRGFIGNSETFRGNRTGEVLFVNERMIDCLSIARAVERAYAPLLMVRRFPAFILHLTVAPEDLDVNVHPQKSTVRFANERSVQRAVSMALTPVLGQMLAAPQTLSLETAPDETESSALRKALNSLSAGGPGSLGRFREEGPAESLEPSLKPQPLSENEGNLRYPEPFTLRAGASESPSVSCSHELPSGDIREAVSDLRDRIRTIAPENGYDYRAAMNSSIDIPREEMTLRNHPQEPLLVKKDPDEVPPYRMAGVLFHTYLVVETGDEVLILDQHAAHERLLYEQFMAAFQNREPLSQQLLIPQVLEVTHDDMLYIGEHMDSFRELGFVLEEYGRLSYQIRAVPMIMGQASAKSFFVEALDLLKEQKSADMGTYRDRIIQLACKKAVKGGDVLDGKEIEAILRMIGEEGVPLTCPHGRPLVMSLSRRELEKKFKRLV